MDQMDRSAAVRAQRHLAIVRVDLSVMRGEVKSLWHLARAVDNREAIKATTQALDRLDQAIKALDDATLFHPTLF